MMQQRVAPPFPFVCPACAAAQTTDLLTLARRGSVECTACGRRLTSAHVMKARDAPRKPVA